MSLFGTSRGKVLVLSRGVRGSWDFHVGRGEEGKVTKTMDRRVDTDFGPLKLYERYTSWISFKEKYIYT